MATVILLTAAQAAQVSGASEEVQNFAALQPIALTDGRFILGPEVLDDPAHVEDRAFLSALPQVEFSTVAALMPKAKP
jgi:hypothetical protein